MTIEKVKFTLRMDATLSVSAGSEQHWIKPGAESSITFSGVPDKKEIALAASYMQEEMLEPTLDKVVDSIHEQLMRLAGQTGSEVRTM